MTKDNYLAAGTWHGVIAEAVAFIGAWIYCISTSGFLLGFGLGWLPAGILAYIVFWVFTFLWLPFDVLVGAAIVGLVVVGIHG
jgi:hypothetical protein